MESCIRQPAGTEQPSVRELFALVPDHRRARSTVYPLAAMLALVVAGLLAGQSSMLAIAEWSARLTPRQRRQLGLPPDRTPHQTTIHRVLAGLGDEVRLIGEGAISTLLARRRPARGAQGIAIDGQTHRGHEAQASDVVSAFDEHGGVLATVPIVHPEQGKVAGELTLASQLVARVARPGWVIIADALCCQRAR